MALLARHAGVVREDRDVGEARLVDPQTELAREERAAAGRVDDRARANLLRRRPLVGRLHGCGHALVVERDVEHAMPLAHVCAARRGVLQQQMIEPRARHLPRLRPADVRGRREIEVALDAAVGGHERRAPFLREAGLAHEPVGADRHQHVVHRREERLADVKAWKLIALDEHDFVSGAREP